MPDAGYKLRLHPFLAPFVNFFSRGLLAHHPHIYSRRRRPFLLAASSWYVNISFPFSFHVSSFLLVFLLKKTKKKIRCCDGFPLSFGHRGCEGGF
jgi:hypothetical protein